MSRGDRPLEAGTGLPAGLVEDGVVGLVPRGPVTFDVEWQTGDGAVPVLAPGDDGGRMMSVRFIRWPSMVTGLLALGTRPPAWCYTTWECGVEIVGHEVGMMDGGETEVTVRPRGEAVWR